MLTVQPSHLVNGIFLAAGYFTFDDATATALMGVVSGTIVAGSGYSGTPTIAFSAPPAGGTTATGTVTLTGDAVTAIIITNAGSGYLTPPTATITGAGTGATYTSIKLKVVSFSITNGGSGFTTTPSVTVTGNATSTATLTSGVVTGLSVTGTNTNYTAPPTVTISPPETILIPSPFGAVAGIQLTIVGSRAADEHLTPTSPSLVSGYLSPTGGAGGLITLTRAPATRTAGLTFLAEFTGR